MPRDTATETAAEIGERIRRHRLTVLEWHKRGHVRGYIHNCRRILFDWREVQEDMQKNNLKPRR